MASLKDFRVRIASVKSTQHITSAMKMVAAAKLRRAQEEAIAARPYSERMERMLGSLAESAAASGNAPALLAGNGKDDTHLIVVMTTDRGLCGGFNGSIGRWTRQHIQSLRAEGKEVKLLIVGRKGRGILRADYGDMIIDTLEDTARTTGRGVDDSDDPFEAAGEVVAELLTTRGWSVVWSDDEWAVLLPS